MAYTHDFRFKLGDYTFQGEVEINNAGVVAFKEDGGELMPQKTLDAVRKVLDLLGPLPAEFSDLKDFRLKLKSE